MRAALLSGGGLEAVRRAAAAGAELVVLPQLSFLPYLPGRLDRAGLEHAERPPARTWLEAAEAAGGAWLAASCPESEGEGVFYLSALLGRAGEGPLLRDRQRRLAAQPGRWEPLLYSPGHEAPAVAPAPWGRTGLLVGADVGDPVLWAQLAAAGAQVVLGGVSEDAEGWERVRRVVGGCCTTHGLAAAVANRGGEEAGGTFAGGGAAWAAGGAPLAVGDDGFVTIEGGAG